MIREILIRKDSVSMLVYISKCFRIEKVWIKNGVVGIEEEWISINLSGDF